MAEIGGMEEKALVSYCLFCFNQEAYISKAVEAALRQTYSPLEIIISDDCSQDNSWPIITELVKNYRGIHRVIVNRNKINEGVGKHFSTVCYGLASGDYIITSGGDDISKQDHVKIAVSYMLKYSDVGMIDFCAEIIDKHDNVVDRIKHRQAAHKYGVNDLISGSHIPHFAPGRIIRKTWLKTFPPIGPNCPTEDSALVYRSLFTTGYYLVNEPLVQYRIHGKNLSSLKNLRKLSNTAIINQNKADLSHLTGGGRLNSKMIRIIRARIRLEFILRMLRYSYLSVIMHERLQRLCVRLAQFIYRKYLYLVEDYSIIKECNRDV